MATPIFREALRNALKKRATILYPFERRNVCEDYRGKIEIDYNLCIGCGLCVKDCPALALELVQSPGGKRKPKYYVSRCTFCAQCVESCPRKAIKTTPIYELVTYDRKAEVVEPCGT
ncbi:MAG: 4Fe-4S binding protein [Candidatus Nezhaarchaeota archaeon]|nr:4Fe-4S binding protein [Candidatus Nezhaarchaeota archaeon]MCX8142228.1 4Fe-4S binding protein [Candidatus Nezhaarchaeota archaeon]MDW8050799.1 4Fe-4S binding protein [Nitrososphaerota archaeon]